MEAEEEEEEGGTETETQAPNIINASTISTTTIPTTTPTMHHSSPGLTPATTACRAPGLRPFLLTCCWASSRLRGRGASARRPG